MNNEKKERGKRGIVFQMINLSKESLKSVGIYKITNTVNGKFYIGSTQYSFNERFKSHCREYERFKIGEKEKSQNPILWKAYDKYGITNFSIEIIEIMDGETHETILIKEEQLINDLKPAYNVSLFPTCGGKPNLNKKLTDEWKNKISEKSKSYKHSDETLQIVTENNKKNSVKLTFVKDNEQHNFNSWVEAGKYFNTSPSALSTAHKRRGAWKNYVITKLSTQTKKIKVFIDESEIIFNSYSECDKYFDMWRGYTSELLNKKSKQLIKNKYDYEII